MNIHADCSDRAAIAKDEVPRARLFTVWPLLYVDGVTYRNDPDTYGEITIGTTAYAHLKETEDHRVQVIAAGRTAFSVTALDGTKYSFLVVSTEPTNILTLPANLTRIDAKAFYGVTAQKVVLPSSCESIGSMAFAQSNVQLAGKGRLD